MNNKLMLGSPAPPFKARTTRGNIDFPADLNDKWSVLYVHSGAFLPNSATDILELDSALPRFLAYNATVTAMSHDSVAASIAWLLSLRNLKKDGNDVNIEIISDSSLEIAKRYGISNTSDDINKNEKLIIITDPDGIVRSVHRYSQGMGINVTEIERELLALQTARYQFSQTPAGWTPGDDILEHPPRTITTAGSNIAQKEGIGLRCIDWYICFRQDSGLRKQSPNLPE
jgi:peroxiredoxin (alkyl hydroperoxide reductase subunit C)